jgi:hypothetical protein
MAMDSLSLELPDHSWSSIEEGLGLSVSLLFVCVSISIVFQRGAVDW